ncbi:uncharacterized protein LOC135213992 [Macrobrachium nipponense]|uniref:uncharacterized protein LOC135213992 n=1 Tax=Macrobrachium nipponense TaxID=159736 RepID=UPI0030C897B7
METAKTMGDIHVGDKGTEMKEGDVDVGDIETEQKCGDNIVGDRETEKIIYVGAMEADDSIDISEVKTENKANDVVGEKTIEVNCDVGVGDVGEGGKDAGDAKTDQRYNENTEMEGKTGMDKPGSSRTLSKSFSLETVDCDYIDQTESESESTEKTVMERLNEASSTQHSSESLLNVNKNIGMNSLGGSGLNEDVGVDNRHGSDLIMRNGQKCEGNKSLNRESAPGEDDRSANRKNEQDSMNLEGLLQLLLNESHFLGSDCKETKKMPKSLQRIQKEEDKMMNWKVIEGKCNENLTVINDNFEENIHDKGAKENARVSDAKRKRSLSVPKDENNRKRLASGGGNYSILDKDTTRDNIPLESGNVIESDNDSVFGDSEDDSDDESDGERYPDVTKKRVKIESFSSAVSNILEEMGPNNTSIDTDDLTDYDEESSVEVTGEKLCDEGSSSQDLIECSGKPAEEMKDRDEVLVSPVNRVTSINRPKPSDQQKPGTNIKVEMDANLKWIREVPPPFAGPKCTCESPGTPPWKLASHSGSQGHDASCELTLESSSEHEVVSVKLRRPRCSSFSPETASSPYQKRYSHSELGCSMRKQRVYARGCPLRGVAAVRSKRTRGGY